MPMSIEKSELFLNYCNNIAHVHMKQIGCLEYDSLTLPTIIMDFLSDCKTFFEMDLYKTYSNHDAILLVKDIYDKIDAFRLDDARSFKLFKTTELANDFHWIEIQKLAKKAEKALETFQIKVRSDG